MARSSDVPALSEQFSRMFFLSRVLTKGLMSCMVGERCQYCLGVCYAIIVGGSAQGC